MITLAQTFLNQHHIPYKRYEYECTTDHDFAQFASHALQIPPERIFKTIILVSGKKTYVSAITPADGRISLKNAARILGLKSLELAERAEVMRVTGYVIGGVSPFGQKRRIQTLLCSTALRFEEILVSGGRRGFSVGVNPHDLARVLEAATGDFLDPAHPVSPQL